MGMKQTGRILEVEVLSPRLRRLRFGGLVGLSEWSPGDKVKLGLESGVKRSYTPSAVDAESGWMDVVVHLHGNGPFSAWASACDVGAEARVMGPKRSLKGELPEALGWVMFLGDETALGVGKALTDSVPEGVAVCGAVELDAADVGAGSALGLRAGMGVLAREGRYGDVLRAWLDGFTLPEGRGVVWLAGHTQTTYDLREVLRGRGLERSAIRLKAYWSDRGHDHRKAVEKQQASRPTPSASVFRISS